jgi:two-component SAPR family response regulator
MGARFESADFKGTNPQCLAATFIQELETSVPDYFALVIEDFHEVEDSQPVIDFLDTVIPDLPENCHLIISSRSDPKLRNFRRMMVNREAFMLTQDDLKFNAEESRDLLNQISDTAVSDERAQAINEQCAGWPGAMIMAMQGSEIRPERNAGGELFSEYLAEEMLERQSHELQGFLITTSIFPILIPNACDALMGIDNSLEKLKELARQNLAIEVAAPDEVTAYAYHSLLRQLTRTKLHDREQDSLKELGSRAGDQLRERGYWEEALDVYSDVGAYMPAADLLVVVSEEMAAEKHWKKLASVVDLLPKPVITSVPELAIRRAHAATEAGDLVYASQLLDEVASQKGREDFAGHMPWVLLEQSNIKLHQSETKEAQGLILQAQRLMESQDSDPTVVAQAHHALGISYAISRQFTDAKASLELGLEFCASNFELERMSAKIRSDLGTLMADNGNSRFAKVQFERAAQTNERLGDDLGRIIAMNNLGYAYFLLAQFPEAIEVLENSISESKRLNLIREEAYAQVTLGDVYAAYRQYDKAVIAYTQGNRLGKKCDERRIQAFALDGLARCAADSGQIRWARLQLDEGTILAQEADSSWQHGVTMVSRAIIDLKSDEIERALGNLDDALAHFDGESADLDECRARLYKSHVLKSQGDIELMHEELERMVEILGVEGRDPYFLVSDITRTPQLREMVKDLPGLDLISENLCAQVDHVFSEIGQAEQDKQFTHTELPDYQDKVSVTGFGRAAVEVNGKEIQGKDWRSKRAKELFFLLAYHGRPLTKDEIIAALWPEDDVAKAESGLKSNLFRARRALSQDWIVYEDGKYRLDPQSDFDFDVKRFGELLRAADRLSEDAALKPRYIEQAVNLYSGDFLPECYSEWCLEERAMLSRWFMDSASMLAHHHEALENHDRVASISDKILSVDPYNEDALSMALAAHAEMGNIGAAEHRYRTYRDMMQSELGVPPSPKMERLIQSLL